MKKIEGSPKNLKQLLQNTKYSIHYYQREYMWQRKHIEELIDDLTSEFLDYYKTDDPRQAVADYAHILWVLLYSQEERMRLSMVSKDSHL